MKVLFVCNNAFNKGNGLSTSVHNTIQGLKEYGIDARLMAVSNPDPNGRQPDFPLGHFKFPLFEPIIYANGFSFAKLDRKEIERAVEWADVVHLQEAFPLQQKVRKIAEKLGKPCTATCHLYPHNVAANLGMGKVGAVNNLIAKYFKHTVFGHCPDIQCPTKEVAEYLRSKGVKGRLHIISNGIFVPETPVVAQKVNPEPVADILCIGRLAPEKSQQTLLNAMRYSKHTDRIRLVFAGNGPKAAYYKKMADRLYREGVLKHPASFGFYDKEALAKLSRESYLYIHCAWVEVEGLSCLEATREGIVPVIGEGRLVGTTAFALCPESRYPVGDSRALAERIDWWIEHPEERNRMAQEYADAARKFDIKHSIEALAGMFRTAMENNAR